MTSDDGRIAQANARLKAGQIGVRIERIGRRLYLTATLPPKPNSPKTKPHQQRIALGIHANPAGIQFAEKQARKVGGLLDCKEFSWEPYLKPVDVCQPQTTGDWVQLFQKEFGDSVSSVTWKTDYHNVFAALELDQPISPEILKAAILRTKPNTRTRRRFCLTLGRLAKFAGLDVTFRSFQGNYSAKLVQPRDLPTDAAIAAHFRKIQNPGWRWIYGMIAVYGLRAHEAFFLDTEGLESGRSLMISVLEGKTGFRSVLPFYPEWVDEFNLREKHLPKVTGKTHVDFTHRVANYFQRVDLPFSALDLRHCWAVRTLLIGFDISLAAQQMGHSIKVHSETYHHWITKDIQQKAYEQVLQRTDRLQAPFWAK